jgi:hypothetical protein
MAINKPSKDLQDDLRKVAVKLRRSGISLMGTAIRLSEAGFDDESLKILAIAKDLGDAEDVIDAYEKEVESGVVVRSSFN